MTSASKELLALAQSCGATLTGIPDGSEPITVVFTIDSWQAFDRAVRLQQTEPEQDLRPICSADGCNRREPCGPYCDDNGNFDKQAPAVETAKQTTTYEGCEHFSGGVCGKPGPCHSPWCKPAKVNPKNLPTDNRWYENKGGKFVPVDAETEQRLNKLVVPDPGPHPKRQYYLRNGDCQAEGAGSSDCVCWYDEGTGPLALTPERVWMWRDKP